MDKDDFLVNLHYLPIIIFIGFPFVFILTYIIAVALGHVEPAFPYISDTTTNIPESCISAQVLNILALLVSLLMYIRYSQIKECVIALNLQEFLSKCNHWALLFGLTSVISLSVLANFQETAVLVVHTISAFLCFSSLITYFWLQAICTFYLHPIGSSLRIAHFRIALATFCTVFFVISFIISTLLTITHEDPIPITWQKSKDDWGLRLTSTITEWLCMITSCIYFLTFTHDFKGVKLINPKVVCTLSQTRQCNDALNESQNPMLMNDRHGITNT